MLGSRYTKGIQLDSFEMTSINLGLFLGLIGWKEGEISLPLLETPDFQWALLGSNQRPPDYESDALTG